MVDIGVAIVVVLALVGALMMRSARVAPALVVLAASCLLAGCAWGSARVAAGDVTPLTRWRRFDAGRQELMKAELQRILAEPNLVRDVHELVAKSL